MPTTLRPTVRATDCMRISTEGTSRLVSLTKSVCQPSQGYIAPTLMMLFVPPGATSTFPASSALPLVAAATGSAETRRRRSTSVSVKDAGKCTATTTAQGKSTGNNRSTCSTAGAPPVEPPITTTPRGGNGAATGRIPSVKGSAAVGFGRAAFTLRFTWRRHSINSGPFCAGAGFM
ncbi:hypothetical protein SAMN06265337_1177 [Hymenobacter gelipurpurascens]|uniref:Uncharacterized protein n=1 Tax=Hymenobacter gelipurpurascens TaxID=89968 RepID=A0A212TFX2_9BACT|nr:hypothetical protein SAMN06265337_1177 [Hymenobacter gelipurpurascens]